MTRSISQCSGFVPERNCIFTKMDYLQPGFCDLNDIQKCAVLLCPISVTAAKLANRYIKLIFNTRKLLDEGVPALNLNYECGMGNYLLLDNDSDLVIDYRSPSIRASVQGCI